MYLKSCIIQIYSEFIQINGYPEQVFEKINEEYKLSGNLNIASNNKSNINNDITNTTYMLVLPFKGEAGERIIQLINKAVKIFFSQNNVIQNVYRKRSLAHTLI